MSSNQQPPAPKSYHPADDPNFNPTGVVWYLSHPIAPDDKFTLEQNMRGVEYWLGLCLEEGFKTIAPYHTHILICGEGSPKARKLGLETDCCVVKSVRHMILAGHKLSKGMAEEMKYALTVLNLIGMTTEEARQHLRRWKGQ